MKSVITFLLLMIACTLSAQEGTIKCAYPSKDYPGRYLMSVVNNIVIDDEQVNHLFFKAISSEDIKSILILKHDSAISEYGEKGKNGALIITLKKLKKGARKGNLEGININSKNFPLIVIDEVVCPTPEIGRLFINYMKPEIIDSISVIKGEQATSLYGEKAKNGVVLVTLKGEKPEKTDIPPYEPKS